MARTFVTLADTLVDEFDVVDILTLLVDRCVELFGVAAAGVMLADSDGILHVAASSSEAMRVLELFELQAEQGPCLDCFHSGELVINQDLAIVNGRWPDFAPVALEAGYRSVHAVPLRLRGSVIGALNLFGNDITALNEADVHAAQALADVATIAVLSHRNVLEATVVNEQLTFALNSRIMIEQAKGILSVQSGKTMEHGFSLMRSYARSNNRRLREVAQGVIDRTLSLETLEHPSKQG
ncbi:MAG: GAF and ANTAR domain-containing protein [Nitrososphaerales archaeon]